MSQNLISKAYHSAKALHTSLKDQRTQKKEFRDLKVRAANSDNPQALGELKQQYEQKGLPVKQLYVKTGLLSRKVHVSRNPPLLGEKSARNWFTQLEAISKKSHARATQNAVKKVIEHPANDCTDSSETAAWKQVIGDLDEVMNPSTRADHSAQSSLVESSSESSMVESSSESEEKDFRPADDHDIRERRNKRSQKLDKTFALVRDFNKGSTDPFIKVAIDQATDMPFIAAMYGKGVGFASALTYYLPTPPDSSPDISDLAKLDYYLRNTSLSADLSDSELALVKNHYLDCWAEHDKSEAAAKASGAL